jgi:hypothetical protein
MVDHFHERGGESFEVYADEGAVVALELVEVKPLGETPAPETRAPFSLVFRGPLEPALPQQTRILEHAELGALEILLVPIGPDDCGHRYEAIFG